METTTKIKTMLLENTGKGLFDSGSMYGYAFETRAAAPLEDTPVFNLTFHFKEDGTVDNIEASISLYHWLCGQDMKFDAEFQAIYDAWYDSEEGVWDIDEFIKYLKLNEYDVSSYDSEEILKYNSYNGESVLDGHFVCAYLTVEKDGVALFSGNAISTHNGCDARSGYSRFGFFEGDLIYGVADCEIICEGPPTEAETQPTLFEVERDTSQHAWSSTDGGYSFAPDSSLSGTAEHDFNLATATRAELTREGSSGYFCPICGGALKLQTNYC